MTLEIFPVKKFNLAALADITKFIAQEIYKIAVLYQYPNEYNKVFNLAQSITEELADLFGQDFDLELEALIDTLINLIVHRATEPEFKEQVSKALWGDDINQQTINCTTHKQDDIENSNPLFEYEKHECEIKMAALDIANKIFSNNRDFNTGIPHIYPPSVIGHWFDYYQALEHYYGLSYIPQQKPKTEKEEIYTYEKAPYRTTRPYADRKIEESHYVTHELPLAISSAEDSGDGQPIQAVKKIVEIRFRLDLSEPLTNEIVEKVFTRWRISISNAQSINKASSMLCAQSNANSIQARKTPHLACMDITELEWSLAPFLPELDSPFQAKNYLCGLITLFEHYVRATPSPNPRSFSWNKNDDRLTITSRFDVVSKKLSKIHGEDGFSAGSIENGYKLVNSVFKRHIGEFQKGRVQFNISLNKKQRDKLKKLKPVPLENLHESDVVRVQEEIKSHQKKGNQASVKIQENGSYVITW